MPELDLRLTGGLALIADEPVPADIGIKDGRIAVVGRPGEVGAAARTIDAGGGIILPGGIDPHVHTRWPFLQATTADDFYTSTRAAALGGTTTILDSVIRRSPQSVADAIAGRRDQADSQVVIDYALHCAVGDPDDFDPAGIAPAAAEGVAAIKLYLAYKARGIMAPDGLILRVMEAAAAAGAIVKVHAENGLIADANAERFYAEGHTTAEWFPRTKPPWVEAEAIARAATIARRTGVTLYVVHVSSEAGLAEVVRARTLGARVFAETCPQYLLLDESVFARPDGHRFQCSPPVRTPRDQEALWDGIASGAIDTIGSDHCVFLAEQKDAYRDDFARVPNGLPGVETRLPLVLSEGARRGIGLRRLADVLSTNVARIFGIHPEKGVLAPGSDADLVVWDPARGRTIRNEDLHMGCDWTPYEGMVADGWPRTVVSGGRVTVDDGVFAGERGLGRYLVARARPASSNDAHEGLGG